jgi:hypothetical protein
VPRPIPALREPRRAAALIGLLLLALLFTEIDPGVWPTGLKLKPFGPPVNGTSLLLGVLLAALIPVGVVLFSRTSSRSAPGRPVILLSAVLALGLLAGGGYALARSYGHRRYVDTQPLPLIYAWAQKQHHARIGIVGLDIQYPLYGTDGTNYVQYIAAPAPHGGTEPITTCQVWRRAVNRGHYGWLLVTPFGFPLGSAANVAPEVRWTGSSPAARPTLRELNNKGETAVLFRIRGPLDPATCPL